MSDEDSERAADEKGFVERMTGMLRELIGKVASNRSMQPGGEASNDRAEETHDADEHGDQA